jgi:hypothetical protein
MTGTGSHDLTVTGNLDLDGALTSVVDLSVSGTPPTSVPMSPQVVHKPIRVPQL